MSFFQPFIDECERLCIRFFHKLGIAASQAVLASDVAPVREVIEPGFNGLLEPLLDADRLTATALEVLARPAEFAGIRREARRTIEERYGIDACIPPIKDFLERVASGRGAC